MILRRLMLVFGLVCSLAILTVSFAWADGPVSHGTDGEVAAEAKASHRLIVQLESAPLAEWAKLSRQALGPNGRLDTRSAAAQAYLAQLQQEQAAFVNAMQGALPSASVAAFINENNRSEVAAYQIVFNGMSVEAGLDREEARRRLANLPGVKAVYLDYAYQPLMYTSTTLINAPVLWNNAAIGGQENAGAGIKVASMDGGVHKDAPMFSGAGYSYPPGYPPNGLGLTENNNGKIIASRAYFRSWDPPAPGDENPWPGENGTSHGVHTAGSTAGNAVEDVSYLGFEVGNLSGVAPKAWVMSYRVFYASVNGNESFYTTEGIAALEDIVADGADVVNNSWGEGPTSVGGEFDPLDQALINASNSGVFVSMSAGNSGPGPGTTDHPSDEYIIVAASTTSGTLASGVLNIVEPTPISATLQDLIFSGADFGAPLPLGTVTAYSYTTSTSVDSANVTGCDPWTGTPFTGKAAVISRGGCFFTDKVYHAEQAGAEFVVIYNNAGDGLINMSCGGDFCDPGEVTIPSIFVGQTDGEGIVSWHDTYGDASVMTLNTVAFQAGSTADLIINFSSRGPGSGNVLKPDIAAPGVNILSQGYTPGASGEARHLGFGQASGTSMASPHVAGAAALVKQVHPTWSNAYIKSALMSTAKYTEIYNQDGSPAQPLDMGAGRLDLTNVTDPGVILSPPSVSFGLVPEGDSKTMTVMVTSVADSSETYNLYTLFTGGGFTSTTLLPGFTVSPSSVTLAAGATAEVEVTFDSAAATGLGDHQGYIVMAGNPHEAHMPTWARVVPATATADVLIIDNDFSEALAYPDYVAYYTTTVEALGMSYNVYDADAACCGLSHLPNAATLAGYKAIIYFTGDHFEADGTFTVPTPLTEIDENILTEYVNNGGILIAMGQDLAAVLGSDEQDGGSFLYGPVLGANWLQDSVSGFSLPQLPVVSSSEAPPAFEGISLHVGDPGHYLGTSLLSGANEVPPVTTNAAGSVSVDYDAATNLLQYVLTVSSTDMITITAAHIHTGTVGTNGGVEVNLNLDTTVISDSTYSKAGSVLLSPLQEAALLNDGLYVNVHSVQNPTGEVRAQLMVLTEGDGAANQYFIDEIQPHPSLVDIGDPLMPEELEAFTGLLTYPGSNNMEDGFVAVAHREQPTLESPGIAYNGRSIYTSFGLEGVNNGVGGTSRESLLRLFLAWGMDEPTVIITNTTPMTNASNLTTFEAHLVSPVSGQTAGLPVDGVEYRWDFGDGSAIVGPFNTTQASRKYPVCGTYTVRVEATDSLGNKALGSLVVPVGDLCDAHKYYLPLVFNP